MVDILEQAEITANRKPEPPAPAPKKIAETPDEPSYDERSRVLKFRKTTYLKILKINKLQLAAVRRLYDTAAGGGAGVPGKVLTELAGLHGPNPRLRNAYQYGDAKKLYKDMFSYDRSSELYRFKPSVSLAQTRR